MEKDVPPLIAEVVIVMPSSSDPDGVEIFTKSHFVLSYSIWNVEGVSVKSVTESVRFKATVISELSVMDFVSMPTDIGV